MHMLTERTKKDIPKYTTSQSIHDKDLLNQSEEVKKRGHAKPYSAGPISLKKLSARKESKVDYETDSL